MQPSIYLSGRDFKHIQPMELKEFPQEWKSMDSET